MSDMSSKKTVMPNDSPKDAPKDADPHFGPSPVGSVVLFFVFLAICFGLGYPALSRYVPWEAGNFDSWVYYRMVIDKPVGAPMAYRPLVPTMARGVLWVLAHFQFGRWDPVWLSLLVVNAIFVALSASIVMRLATVVARDATVAAAAPMIYLASFVVVNYHLAGMIDAGEGFFLSAILLALIHDRWWPVPILITIGVLAKETILPFGLTAAFVWWAVGRTVRREIGRKENSGRAWIAIGASVVGGSLAMGICRHLIDVPPYEAQAFSLSRVLGAFSNLGACVFEKTQLYAFALLLPMGLPRLRRIPGPLLAASLGMAVVATLLGAYAGIQGNLHRPWFNAFGPVLAISSAMLMRDLIVGRKPDAISQ